QQIGADRVEQVVAGEVEIVDQRQRGCGAVDLGDRDRAVQRNDRTGGQCGELVVELQDLPPVRRGSGGGVGVHGVDRRLDLVRAGLVASEALPDEGLALGDEGAIPAGAV